MTAISILINVLDDNEIDTGLIVSMLNENPMFKAEGFTSIEQFKSSLNKDINLVITDFRIGQQNTLEVIKFIRLNYPGTHIIVISAYFTEETYINLIRCRVSDVVRKDGAYWIDNLIIAVECLVPEITTKILSLSEDDNG